MTVCPECADPIPEPSGDMLLDLGLPEHCSLRCRHETDAREKDVEKWRRRAEESEGVEWCPDCKKSYSEHYDECPHCRSVRRQEEARDR